MRMIEREREKGKKKNKREKETDIRAINGNKKRPEKEGGKSLGNKTVNEGKQIGEEK